jgi:plastocyanin
MNAPRTRFLGFVLLLAAVACGGGGTKPIVRSGGTTVDQATPVAPTCSPAGTTLEISASDSAFDRDCLAIQANTPFTVEFQNKDHYSHDFAIFQNSTAHDLVFRGDAFVGPKSATFQVGALTPGTYFYRCDFHLRMTGTLVVAG